VHNVLKDVCITFILLLEKEKTLLHQATRDRKINIYDDCQPTSSKAVTTSISSSDDKSFSTLQEALSSTKPKGSRCSKKRQLPSWMCSAGDTGVGPPPKKKTGIKKIIEKSCIVRI